MSLHSPEYHHGTLVRCRISACVCRADIRQRSDLVIRSGGVLFLFRHRHRPRDGRTTWETADQVSHGRGTVRNWFLVDDVVLYQVIKPKPSCLSFFAFLFFSFRIRKAYVAPLVMTTYTAESVVADVCAVVFKKSFSLSLTRSSQCLVSSPRFPITRKHPRLTATQKPPPPPPPPPDFHDDSGSSPPPVKSSFSPSLSSGYVSTSRPWVWYPNKSPNSEDLRLITLPLNTTMPSDYYCSARSSG
jgi:hypothetical protein